MEPEDTSKTHGRHRKKNFYNSIRQQMEFYFGDANLSKDRFLSKLIRKDPYIPLETFLTFNKMKKLATSIEDISKALSNSTFLELSEDGKKVRRKTEIPKERDVDNKVIYVESLPPHADHDWITKVFSRYGPIAYISLPKYKKSRKIKEFGFIEFEIESSVDKLLKTFKEFDGVLGLETTDPSQLKSIKTFIEESNEEKDQKHTTKEDNSVEKFEDESGKKQNDDKNEGTNIDESNETLKRKKEDSETKDDEDAMPAKKQKVELEENNENESKESSSSGSESSDTEVKSDELKPNKSNSNTDVKSETAGIEPQKKKKNRKHKKKKNQLSITDESDFRALKIMPKMEWKRLRNTYLNMQRKKMSECKKILQDEKRPFKGFNIKKNDLKQNQPQQQQSHPNVNFYGAEDQSQAEEKGEKKSESKILNIEPGTIVRIKLLEPCTDVKELKNDMKQHNCVKYVDITEGSSECYVRCDTSQNCEDFVKQISCAEYQCQILRNNEEKDYWQKIQDDRENKVNKKIKVKGKRGKEKVVKAIASHIRFNDDDE